MKIIIYIDFNYLANLRSLLVNSLDGKKVIYSLERKLFTNIQVQLDYDDFVRLYDANKLVAY